MRPKHCFLSTALQPKKSERSSDFAHSGHFTMSPATRHRSGALSSQKVQTSEGLDVTLTVHPL